MNELHIGPQHPSLPGLLRLDLTTEGEICKKIIPSIGFQHRSFEKLAENLPYASIIPYVDRLDYLSSMNNELAYAMTVEKLLGIQIPKRAEVVRVMMAELNRIASHLFYIGTLSKILGSSTPYMMAMVDRELILDIFEMACGARLLHNYIWIGGIWKDVTPGIEEKIRDFCGQYLPSRLDEFNTLLTYNPIFIRRTAHVGILNLETALTYGITGPNLRACGKAWDLRKNIPYSIYNELDFSAPTGTAEFGTLGDSWNRTIVRIQEIKESLKIVNQALNQISHQISQGPFQTKLETPIKPAQGEVFLKTENPRGELGFYIVSDGTVKPYRVKVKTPSFSFLSCLHELCTDVTLSDVFTILGSLDINMGEIDR